MTRLTNKDAGELFLLRVRGMFARMHALRQSSPYPEVWQFLRGERDMTMREMGELAAELGFHIEIDFADIAQPAQEQVDAE